WPRGIHDLGASGNCRQGHSAAERFCGDDETRLDTEMGGSKELSGAAKPGLYLIGNEDDAALAADLRQRRQEAGWGHDKATFPKHRLNHNGSDGLGRHHTAKGLIEQFVYLLRGHRPALRETRIGSPTIGDAIDIG